MIYYPGNILTTRRDVSRVTMFMSILYCHCFIKAESKDMKHKKTTVKHHLTLTQLLQDLESLTIQGSVIATGYHAPLPLE